MIREQKLPISRKVKVFMYTFLIAGGDLRYITLADKLAESPDNAVFAVGFDAGAYSGDKSRIIESLKTHTKRADCLILPIPATVDGINVNAPFFSQNLPINELLPFIKTGGKVFAAKLPIELTTLFEAAGFEVIDYSLREDFAVMNAVATSEGAIQVAMEKLPCTLSTRNILVLGMGRIAKTLLKMLRAFSPSVTAAARKTSDIAWAEILGGQGVHLTDLFENAPALAEYDLIFNTVPNMILSEEKLRKLNKNALIIDLASRPGGVDFEAAKRLGIKTEWALSIPGKVAPVTSGCVIAQTITNILAGRGDNSEKT
jgi:dipicolinate synthase subunit A